MIKSISNNLVCIFYIQSNYTRSYGYFNWFYDNPQELIAMSRHDDFDSRPLKRTKISFESPNDFDSLQGRLIAACKDGDEEKARQLLRQGASAKLKTQAGEHPFGGAVWGLNPKVIKALLEQTDGVSPMTWDECKFHNEIFYQQIFITGNPEYIYQNFEYLEQLKASADSSLFLREFFIGLGKSLFRFVKYELFLISKFSPEECKTLDGDAIILTNDNIAYFVLSGRVVTEITGGCDLFLIPTMSKYYIDQQASCISGNAVILTNENTAYFVKNRRIVMKDSKPQVVAGVDRRKITLANPYSMDSTLCFDAKGNEVIKEAIAKAGLIGFNNKKETSYLTVNNINRHGIPLCKSDKLHRITDNKEASVRVIKESSSQKNPCPDTTHFFDWETLKPKIFWNRGTGEHISFYIDKLKSNTENIQQIVENANEAKAQEKQQLELQKVREKLEKEQARKQYLKEEEQKAIQEKQRKQKHLDQLQQIRYQKTQLQLENKELEKKLQLSTSNQPKLTFVRSLSSSSSSSLSSSTSNSRYSLIGSLSRPVSDQKAIQNRLEALVEEVRSLAKTLPSPNLVSEYMKEILNIEKNIYSPQPDEIAIKNELQMLIDYIRSLLEAQVNNSR